MRSRGVQAEPQYPQGVSGFRPHGLTSLIGHMRSTRLPLSSWAKCAPSVEKVISRAGPIASTTRRRPLPFRRRASLRQDATARCRLMGSHVSRWLIIPGGQRRRHGCCATLQGAPVPWSRRLPVPCLTRLLPAGGDGSGCLARAIDCAINIEVCHDETTFEGFES